MLNIIFIFLISLNSWASEPENCVRENPESLWVEEYSCDKSIKIQVGHELINNSVVVNNDNTLKQHYQEQDNKVNMDYLKAMHQFKKDN